MFQTPTKPTIYCCPGSHVERRFDHIVLALVFFLFTMEEISWGQRILGFGTPAALEGVNQQDETTIHNLPEFAIIIFFALFWGSVAALAGGSLRALRRFREPTTTMNLVLPSLVLAPALLMIMIWRAGADWVPVNIARLIMDRYDYGPQGSEVPEVLLGLCLCIYTFSNLKRAEALTKVSKAREPGNAGPIGQAAASQALVFRDT